MYAMMKQLSMHNNRGLFLALFPFLCTFYFIPSVRVCAVRLQPGGWGGGGVPWQFSRTFLDLFLNNLLKDTLEFGSCYRSGSRGAMLIL